ncbi:inositol monophosphatase family protein [Aeromicrobium wangtongii]|uniref:Histidinol phosphatase n=1 Tax=Aeromicrobium wangtongii TaxID=2969247 RepID=A0ABY5M3S4_9ACTN|nr:inositol monophosphatase family protein [Aeromicrobium wangtongii]MCD9199129.1 histidinol phosphatase [Aeromicrobium wangtongii]UUP12840.1 histidinol phosphatase [Aeromicrobium wangtongii]
MAHSYNDDLRLAHVLADNADNLSMERFLANDLQVDTKPDMTYVTESDQAVEAAIRRTLKSARGRDVVLGEEQGQDAVESVGGRRWIVDPIDGTANFVRGVPVWATLIALEEDGEIVAGCVSAPALGRRWWASKGTGAFTGKSLMSSRQIKVSQVSDLEAASLSYASLGGWDVIGKGQAFAALMRRCWRTRAYGDFWSYMLLAEGAVDIATEPELNLWDMAALDIIVREAGGTFTSLAGAPGPWGDNALASNGRLHDAAMAYVGHFPDQGPPDQSWTDEPEDDAPPAEPSNVHAFEFSREPADERP